jgi:hypothetical protein
VTFRLEPLAPILRSSLYSVGYTLYKKLAFGGYVYNLALVRQLCADIAAEQDPARVSELADLLQAVVKEDQEEIRVRMAFLAKKYVDVIEEAKANVIRQAKAAD